MGRNGMDALGGISMNPKQMARNMRSPEGIAEMLVEEGPTGDSPAEIFADIVNVHRMDIRRLGQELGVDVDAGRMSPEKAGALLAGTIAGDGVDLVVMFNEMAEKRDQLLQAKLDAEEHEEFLAAKHSAMWTSEPGDFNDDDGE